MSASDDLEALIQRLEHTSKPSKATLNAWAMDLARIKVQVIALEREKPVAVEAERSWQPGRWRQLPKRKR